MTFDYLVDILNIKDHWKLGPDDPVSFPAVYGAN